MTKEITERHTLADLSRTFGIPLAALVIALVSFVRSASVDRVESIEARLDRCEAHAAVLEQDIERLQRENVALLRALAKLSDS